ncbi:hypothetical protein EVAR_27586_1 [Eumeta japonica]|uniref:Uncharacterized protein n=1 Tax=Eumeta variegata TaxID=151549 RepID=A0A4C1WCJ3_EUMVA|nr:hypothetical protein EVAR_27586_1 [Eumeta japonica]
MDAEYGSNSLPLLAECGSAGAGAASAVDGALHPLDPPPPDVLLALLARNKALEAVVTGRVALVTARYEPECNRLQS